jgi:mRNA interferase MazF
MELVTIPLRFDVWLVALDPAQGSEIRKTRPCAILSPDEMNHHLRTALAAPMTTTLKGWPSRIPVTFEGTKGEIALDQIRAVDRERLVRRVGVLPRSAGRAALATLREMFEV